VEGYPGDADYREFYRDIAHDLDYDYIAPYIHPDGIRIDSGLKYYRITGKSNRKKIYDPEAAKRKAQLHAGHFISNREKQIRHLASVMSRKPVVIAPYDAELFGHWWYEGPQWLNYVIRGLDSKKRAHRTGLSQHPIRLITLSAYLKEYPVNQLSDPAISSWGNKGSNETWINASNDWIYRHLHGGAQLMKELAGKYPRARGRKRRALNQAARELLQAQASDWAFIIKGGAHREYAVKRTKTHLLRLIRLKEQIETGTIDDQWLSAIESQNNIFPNISYRIYS
jgi:1,4-alpha-glucan branching enzyme